MTITINLTNEDLLGNERVIEGIKYLTGVLETKPPVENSSISEETAKVEDIIQTEVRVSPPQVQVPIVQTQGTPPVVAAPTAPTLSYSLEQLSLAAAPLMDAGKTQELIAILQSFGVDSLQNLPPEKYGSFAVAVRSLGGQI